MEEKIDVEKLCALVVGCVFGFVFVDLFIQAARRGSQIRSYVERLRIQNIVLTELVLDAYAQLDAKKASHNRETPFSPTMCEAERDAERATSL